MKNPVIIVGANLTGLFTALALSKLGQNSILVDKNKLNAPEIKDGRAIALSYGSRQILEEIGIWTQLTPYAGEIDQIRVTDQYSPLFLHFNNSSTLGYLVESYNLQNIALNKALSDPNITIFDNSNYNLLENNYDQAFISINEQIYKTDLIIAADGKFSQLRKLANINFFQHNYKQTAIVCKVKHHLSHNSIAQEIFLPAGPFAILPLKDPQNSSIVWTEDEKIAKTILKLERDKFNYFLQNKFTNYLGEVELISNISSYPLELIMAEQYYHNHIMLIGDSAHSIHPIAGQGFNLALRDIEALASIYKKFSNIGLNIGCHQALLEYQKLRMNDNVSMALITDCLNKLFSNNIAPVSLLRKIGLSAVNKIPSLQKFFMEYAMAKK
jgi:2-octaprenyl-6-methoxyphenol hydroxylase